MLEELQSRIDYRFQNTELLREALIHSVENPAAVGVRSNVRLAFLGDAVVKLIVSDSLYRVSGNVNLTEERQKFENNERLALAARSLGLDRHLVTSAGKALPDDQLRSPSAPATALEAVIGAVYIDGGAEAAERLVRRIILDTPPSSVPTMV